MKKLILLVTSLCFAQFIFAQTDYRDGYVITHSGDTLFGLIDYHEGSKAYRACDFKNQPTSDNSITYEPPAISGYGFRNDKFFQSKKISTRGDSTKVVFLEVIVKGAVTLYRYEDTYFLEKNNGGPQELINELKETLIDGRRVVKFSNRHIATINMLMADCIAIRDKSQKIKLSERELTVLVEEYNRCNGGSSVIFKVKKPWTRAFAGITTGINISQLTFNDKNDYLSGPFEPGKSALAGVSFDLLSPRLSERFSLHGDILYLKSMYYQYNVYKVGQSTERNYVTIALQQFKLPLGIRYTFPKRTFTPYLNAGISSTLHVKRNSSWDQEVESNGVVQSYSNGPALTIKKNQVGVWGGLGLVKSVNDKLNIFFEARYEHTNGIAPFSVSPQDNAVSKVGNFQLLLGIRTN